MQREIKFRQFCSDEDNHEYGMKYFDIYRNSAIKDGGWSDVMQFTGLLDKNGKEIYEGDLVKFIYNSSPQEEITGEVTWNSEYCAWWFGKYLIEPTPRKTMEIIGNIYENPSLLSPNNNIKE